MTESIPFDIEHTVFSVEAPTVCRCGKPIHRGSTWMTMPPPAPEPRRTPWRRFLAWLRS